MSEFGRLRQSVILGALRIQVVVLSKLLNLKFTDVLHLHIGSRILFYLLI